MEKSPAPPAAQPATLDGRHGTTVPSTQLHIAPVPALELHVQIRRRTVAQQFLANQRFRIALDLMVRSYERDGLLHPLFGKMDDLIKDFDTLEGQFLKDLAGLWKGTAIAQWINTTRGLGPALYVLLSTLPAPIEEYRSVAGLWTTCGLSRDGARPRRRGEKANYSPQRKSIALKRVAHPSKLHVSSAYRVVYDQRRAHTLRTHPPMQAGAGCEHCDAAWKASAEFRASKNFQRERKTIGQDCTDLGGPHWKDGRRDADALRVMAKAILRDAWRVAHGQTPRVATGPIVEPTPLATATVVSV